MKTFTGIKAIGFDLDDTLFMTEEPAWHLENKVVESIGGVPITRQLHRETWGTHILDAIPLRSPGIDVEKFRIAFERMVKEHFETNPDIDPLSNEVHAALIKLGQQGIYLFALTGRDGFETAHLTRGGHPILLHMGAEDIWHKDNLEFPKPDPRAFDWLWRKGYKPSECIYVGDSISDGHAAKGASVHFVATLEGGVRKKEDFKDVAVDAFINKLPEIVSLVN